MVKEALALRRAALTVVAAYALSGCDAGSRDGGTFTLDEETGVATSEIETRSGKARMRAGPSIPARLPAGFTMMPGAKVLTVSTIDSARGAGSLTRFQIEQAADAVIDHYRAEAETAGVVIKIELDSDGTQMIAGKGAGTRHPVHRFSLTAIETDEGTQGELMIVMAP